MMEPTIWIGGRRIGRNHPTYIVAEMSGNHGQDFGRAVAIIRAAKAAGADAIKTQTYTADTLTIDSDTPWFRISGDSLWAGRTLYDLYREACTPWEWQPRLQSAARDLGLDFISSPFDDRAVELLESMNVPAYKIASFENIDHQLLRRVARAGRPVLLSTGLATIEELQESVGVLRDGGAREIALLKCTSAYPAPLHEMNLHTIDDLATRFGVPIGLSDHSPGMVAPVAAVALGASLVEKHFTLSRADGGPDAAFSLEPTEFAAMARGIRTAEAALGQVHYGPTPAERKSLIFRRSLFVIADVRAGELFTEANIRCIRPGHGLHPRHLKAILGRSAAVDVQRGTPLVWDLVEGGEQ